MNSDGFLTSFVDQMAQLRAAREAWLGSVPVNLYEVFQKRDARIIGAIVRRSISTKIV